MLLRLIDFVKVKGITTILTNLVPGDRLPEGTEVGVSSVMDTLIVLRDVEYGNDRTRLLFILKSRGMAHSREIREILFTGKGIDLGPPPSTQGTKSLASNR